MGKGTFCQEEYGAFFSHDIGYLTICHEEYGTFLSDDTGYLTIWSGRIWDIFVT